MGSDDGVKVWIGGKLVHEHAVSRPLVPDQDRIEIDLREGENEVLLRVDQGGGPWGFTFRIDDPGETLKVVEPYSGCE